MGNEHDRASQGASHHAQARRAAFSKGLRDPKIVWAYEASRHRDEVRSGRIQPIPGDQVLAEIRRAVGQ